VKIRGQRVEVSEVEDGVRSLLPDRGQVAVVIRKLLAGRGQLLYVPWTTYALMHLFGDRGTPSSLRCINAFSGHTYKFTKKVGKNIS
jgi:hypothetical protein